MKTGFHCTFALFDTTANADSTLTTTSNQIFGNVSKIKDDIHSSDYATLEKDFFLLDGSLSEMPDIPEDVAYFSSVMSGADGTFLDNPKITISFTENHSSVGLTLYFLADHPTEIVVRWYAAGYVINKKTFVVDSLKFFADSQVENYTGIEIEFTKAKPYRYIKLRYIEYGTELTIGTGGVPVEDASLIEECDPISDKIAVNKLSFKIIDETDNFNTGNVGGLHKALQSEQVIKAYETVNGKEMLLGKFFLQDNSTEKNVSTMTFEDYKGLLDRRKFRAGKVYMGELAGSVIADIMGAAGITDYTVEESVASVPLYGWLKIQTCRKALREVLFACGAVADDSRRETLDIYRPGRAIQSTVHRRRKFSTSYEKKEYVSDVSVKYPVYTVPGEISEIIKGTYAAGTYTVDLSAPAAEMVINTGDIIEQTNNYVTFTVPELSDVVITGKKFNKEELTVVASVDKVSAGQIRASKDYSCTMVDGNLALEAANRILEYFSLQLGLKIRFLNEGEAPAFWSEIYNSKRAYGNLVAAFEKLTTDLTGGFISTADLRGYYKLVSDHYFTGEIFAGESIGDI